MDAVLNWLWQGAVVAIVATGTLRVLDRTRAGVRCLVCWAALIAAVLLPLASFVLATSSPDAPTIYAAAPLITVPVAWWTSSALLAGAWAIWTAIHAVRLVGAIVVVRRARARCRPFPPAVDSSLQHWRRLRHAGRATRLVLSDRVSAAAVFGCGTPVIAVAPTLVASLGAAELDRVVIHEWAHVQRRDDLVNLLQLAGRVLAGWHPAVWWTNRRLQVEREVACDETTVGITGSAKSYARCLLELVDLSAAARAPLPATGVLTGGGLRHRVHRIVSGRALMSTLHSRGLAMAGVAVLLALATTIVGFELFAAVAPRARAATPGLSRPRELPTTSADAGRILEPRPAPPMASPATTRAGADVRRRREARAAAVETGETASRQPPLATLADTSATLSPPEDRDAAASPPPGDEPQQATTAQPDTEPQAGSSPPWAGAADAGVAIGDRSKAAGLATAGAFSRFARRIADSFSR